MLELLFKINEKIMFSNNPLKNNDLVIKKIYPYYIPIQTYGTSLFWAEEYWACMKIQALEKKYPKINFSGLFDPILKKYLCSMLKGSVHEKIIGTKKFSDLSEVIWEDNRRKINIATSHAPSKYISLNYKEEYGKDFGIITFDAHLDLLDSELIHGAWINKELASITTVIGGWGSPSYDFKDAKSSLAFLESDIDAIITNHEFLSWLKGKSIYLTIDLDYYRPSCTNFLGYSNYWHRDKIIGHSMNFDQILTEQDDFNLLDFPISLGEYIGFFPNLEVFLHNKKESLKIQTNDIFVTLKKLMKIFRKNSVTLLSIDFVEYSPICDWLQLTLNEFVKQFPKYSAIIKY